VLRDEAAHFHRELRRRLKYYQQKLPQHACLLEESNVRTWGIGICPPDAPRSFAGWGGRLTLPILDETGEIVAIAGRRLLRSQSAKWLNNPFRKSSVLFGLNRAWEHIVETGTALLVEGYGDVIAFHQKKKVNTVATMGSTASKGQLLLLLRYCQEVIIVPDQDQAGIEGARKTATTAKSVGMKATVIYSPSYYEDPQTLATYHPDLFHELLAGS